MSKPGSSQIEKPIVVYGGTFDPIHKAHLLNLEKAFRLLEPQQIRLVPCYQPVHKTHSKVASEHRLAMMRIALESASKPIRKIACIDNREIAAQEPIYTLDTLINIRQELGSKQPLVWLMGGDSLANLDSWKHWQQLTDLCHFLVLSRPGFKSPDVSSELGTWVNNRTTQYASDLKKTVSGLIYIYQSEEMDAASSDIRSNPLNYSNLLPPGVQNYIRENRLYINAK